MKVVHTSIEDWHAKVCLLMNVGLAGGMEAVVLWYVFQPMNSTIVQLSNGAGKFIRHFMHPAFFIPLTQGAVCVQLWSLFSNMES